MDLKQFWDKKNAKYAAEEWARKPSLFAQWARTYMPSTGKVLELGAGNGQDSMFFRSKGYEVVSTDLSRQSLEYARKSAAKNIRFLEMDMSEPFPFKDETFDAVYAHLSMHYFDEATTGELFSEVNRVLRPGGILAALFNSTDDPEVNEGQAIETNYIDVDGVPKRFFDTDAARVFAKDFKILEADNQGSTYKDEAKGVKNLIRLVAKKA